MAPVASAQISTATVNGTIRDATGSVVPGAETSISNVETGTEQQSVSNNTGLYRFANLQPGLYTLSCVAEVFQTSVVNLFALVVNYTATFDLITVSRSSDPDSRTRFRSRETSPTPGTRATTRARTSWAQSNCRIQPRRVGSKRRMSVGPTSCPGPACASTGIPEGIT